ncbi:hypothetical protein [Pedobacter alpinus]|uniref:Uncharacterized protein n=1 Tax=Pedobacter alpinus TaxID=1590643 RepID=A0ABW5TN32_9SPHI
MKHKSLLVLAIILLSLKSFAQNDLLERLQVLQNKTVKYYNIDNYLITSEIFNSDLNDKRLNILYRKYDIKTKDLKSKNPEIPYNHIYIKKENSVSDQLTQKNSYYFVENKDKMTVIIRFSNMTSIDQDLEKKMVNLIVENTIPKENYASLRIDSINFAGRNIKLNNSCYWTNVNTVQCPYLGEMNWSLHSDLNSAQTALDNQLLITKTKKGIKIIYDELVEVEFEGTPTKAKKVVIDFNGGTSLLLGITGNKTLTVYYVAENIRNHYLACVLSFWNNDDITSTGLPQLLNQVMKINN